MSYRAVDPRKVVVPDIRVTSEWDPEMLEQFRASIKAAGIVEDIILVDVNGKLTLVDGLHRLQEAIKNGDKVVRAKILEGQEKNVHLLNLQMNFLRGKTRPSQMLQVVHRLYRGMRVPLEEIHKNSGLSMDTIERLVQIGDAAPEIWAALDEDRLKLGHAWLLSRVKDIDMQAKLFEQQLLYRWTVGELEEHIKATYQAKEEIAQRKAQQDPTTPAPRVTCFFCKQPTPLEEVANPSICVTCSGVLLESMRQANKELAQERQGSSGKDPGPNQLETPRDQGAPP